MRNIVGKRKIFYLFSACSMIVILLVSIIFGVPMDLQFKGGSMITYSYTGEIALDDFTKSVEDIIGPVNVQKTEDIASKIQSFVITVAGNDALSTEEHENLTDTLLSLYESNALKLEQTVNIDPVMGKEFFFKCLVAIGLASLLMVIYIAFRFKKIGGWSAGLMCVVALVHDMIWVFAAFLFLRIPLNDNFIAAALTILGYSINNTIVIYDRVRENRRIMGAQTSTEELVNTSINQTMKRSIMTTITTLIALFSVLIVALINGLDSIVSFAFPMVVGMIAGFYSSVCLAPELWVSWKNRKAAS